MKHLKHIASLIVTAAVSVSVGMTVCSASDGDIPCSYDFESGGDPYFGQNYGNADMAIESEDTGNKYLRISYNGKENRGRKYYDVILCSSYIDSGIIQIDYDIMYPENTTEKNGELQFKQYTGPGSSETTMVTRVGKNMGYFRTHREDGQLISLKNLNGNTLLVQPGHWYSMKVTVDFDNAKQCIYIFDRDTQELLSYGAYETTIGGHKDINMITFSSGTDMCVDNINIFQPTFESAYIYGSAYVSSATKNPYWLFGLDADKNVTPLPYGSSTAWTLESELAGVSFNEIGNRIIVGSRPEPGYVILCAENTSGDKRVLSRYIVNVSQ